MDIWLFWSTIRAHQPEIRTAALQDYKRAVIIGGTSTYGKGTVQRFVDLDRTVSVVHQFKTIGSTKTNYPKVLSY